MPYLLDSSFLKTYQTLQKIFQRSEAFKGWDASFLNAAQQTGAYVWVSSYHLAGEAPASSKGYVLLLR